MLEKLLELLTEIRDLLKAQGAAPKAAAPAPAAASKPAAVAQPPKSTSKAPTAKAAESATVKDTTDVALNLLKINGADKSQITAILEPYGVQKISALEGQGDVLAKVKKDLQAAIDEKSAGGEGDL